MHAPARRNDTMLTGMKLKKRQIVYTAIAVVIIVMTVMTLVPDPVPVETATVARGSLAVSIESRGETRVRERQQPHQKHDCAPPP